MLLSNLSKSIFSGKNSGKITDDINKIVIKGTPLINSIYITEIVLIIGIFDILPKAKTIPIGNDAIIPTAATTIVSSNPPHLSVGTYF